MLSSPQYSEAASHAEDRIIRLGPGHSNGWMPTVEERDDGVALVLQPRCVALNPDQS